jgi:ribosomal protein S9
MAGEDKDWLSLVGGLLKTGGQAYSSVEANNAAKKAEQQQSEQYSRLAALQNPQVFFAKVMEMKKSLSAEEQRMISQAIAANLVGGGAGGATGIIQEAIADALLKADTQLFEVATNALIQSQGLAGKVLTGPQARASTNLANPFGSLTDLTKLLGTKPTPDPTTGGGGGGTIVSDPNTYGNFATDPPAPVGPGPGP